MSNRVCNYSCVFVIIVMAACAGSSTTGSRSGQPALKEVFSNDFLIGAALNTEQIEGRDTAADHLIRYHFNAVTPENCMKSGNIHPQWEVYEFGLADKLVDYAKKHNLKVNAHTLIWHSQLPVFVINMKDADSLRRFFVNHINTVAGRYDGKVDSWDVVNEALEEDGSLRKSIFRQLLGEDYITEAFRLAQKASPNSKLYYNDYNIEQPKKRAGAIALIKKIQAAGVRIDGVGIQGHWRANNVPMDDIEQSIREFSALGIDVMFTELDLGVLQNPWENNTADPGQTAAYTTNMDPHVTGLPDSVQQMLAKSYANLFSLFLKYEQSIGRITFWGVHDGQSWLNNWPVRGRTNYPLLFDRQYRPKPAFHSIVSIKTNPK